jgi:FMN phosphatase YigB (HAD superfamily)
MRIRAVFFDVGETLIDESRDWGGWADYLGISRLSFFAALGATIERGRLCGIEAPTRVVWRRLVARSGRLLSRHHPMFEPLAE